MKPRLWQSRRATPLITAGSASGVNAGPDAIASDHSRRPLINNASSVQKRACTLSFHGTSLSRHPGYILHASDVSDPLLLSANSAPLRETPSAAFVFGYRFNGLDVNVSNADQANLSHRSARFRAAKLCAGIVPIVSFKVFRHAPYPATRKLAGRRHRRA